MTHFPVKLVLRIDWADLDLFGHVNNVAFFKYVQAARLHYCEQIGLTSLNETGKKSFMVASSHCDFKHPLHYPGMVTVCVKVDWIKTTSMQLAYKILNEQNELCAEAKDILVIYDYEIGSKIEVPTDIREVIRRIEGSDR